jgi:hypothetical protein
MLLEVQQWQMTENEDHLEIRTQSHEQVIEMVICE